jgi:hypothetical protein
VIEIYDGSLTPVPRPLDRFLPPPPLSRTTGGRNIAHHMGKNSPRKRRLLWRLARSVLEMLVAGLVGMVLFGGIWAVYTY